MSPEPPLWAKIAIILYFISWPCLVMVVAYYRSKYLKLERHKAEFVYSGYCDHSHLIIAIGDLKYEVFALREENRILKQVNERMAKEILQCMALSTVQT